MNDKYIQQEIEDEVQRDIIDNLTHNYEQFENRMARHRRKQLSAALKFLDKTSNNEVRSTEAEQEA